MHFEDVPDLGVLAFGHPRLLYQRLECSRSRSLGFRHLDSLASGDCALWRLPHCCTSSLYLLRRLPHSLHRFITHSMQRLTLQTQLTSLNISLPPPPYLPRYHPSTSHLPTHPNHKPSPFSALPLFSSFSIVSKAFIRVPFLCLR